MRPKRDDDDERPKRVYLPAPSKTIISNVVFEDCSVHKLIYTFKYSMHTFEFILSEPRIVKFDNGESISKGHSVGSLNYNQARNDMLNYLRRFGSFKVKVIQVSE